MKVVSGLFNGGELRTLTAEELPSALSYLASDTVRNLVMIGFLKTATSQSQDGTFYGFWKNGILRGVGLLGNNAAWAGGVEVAQALGERARDSRSSQLNMVVGLAHEVEVFLEASQDKRSGKTERQLLYVLRRGELNANVTGHISLRPARRDEGGELFRIHRDLYFELVGHPLPEPKTSEQRLLRRIEDKRIWIASEGDKMLFKADIAFETKDAVLVEAVWTNPDSRGHGIGSRSLGTLCAHLLSTCPMVCLFFRKDHSHLRAFYESIGFKYHGDDGEYTVVRYSSA